MKIKKNIGWFKKSFFSGGSVLPTIALRVIFCTLFSVGIVILHNNGYKVSFPAVANIIPSVILGLLLVFRTNTANDRFWEGRKIWGDINNSIRNISRQVWLIPDRSKSVIERKEFLELLWLYSLLIKNSLRKLDENPTTENSFEYINKDKLTSIKKANNSPLVAMLYLQILLKTFKAQGLFDPREIMILQQLLDGLTNSLGGCQRILKTPIPLAYSIHLNQLVLIYCLSLPFQFVGTLDWITIPVVGITAFAVMGIEEIGAEIENPFGKDTNDLPIDDICDGIKANIDELMKF